MGWLTTGSRRPHRADRRTATLSSHRLSALPDLGGVTITLWSVALPSRLGWSCAFVASLDTSCRAVATPTH